MFWRGMVFLCVLGASWGARSATCVISDIDDTLRVSHVKGPPLQRLVNAFDFSHFWGIPELMRQVQQQADARFYYVSYAPEFWMRASHREFLDRNNLPAGPAYLRRGDDPNHKLRTISNIVESSGCDTLILFGDNADKDPMVYGLIRQRYRDIKVFTYIHQIYPNEVERNRLRSYQSGYLTALDLTLLLARDRHLSKGAVDQILRQLYAEAIDKPRLLNSWRQMLPTWFTGTRWSQPEGTPFRYTEFRKIVFERLELERRSYGEFQEQACLDLILPD